MEEQEATGVDEGEGGRGRRIGGETNDDGSGISREPRESEEYNTSLLTDGSSTRPGNSGRFKEIWSCERRREEREKRDQGKRGERRRVDPGLELDRALLA